MIDTEFLFSFFKVSIMWNSAWFRFSLLNSQSFKFAVKRNTQKTEVHKWSAHAVLQQIKPLDYTVIPELHIRIWDTSKLRVAKYLHVHVWNFWLQKCFCWSTSHITFHSFSLKELQQWHTLIQLSFLSNRHMEETKDWKYCECVIHCTVSSIVVF